MSITSGTAAPRRRPRPSNAIRLRDRIGDQLLRGLCVATAVIAFIVLLEIGYQVVTGSRLAVQHFGFGFLTTTPWQPNFSRFGAAVLIVDTVLISGGALLIAAPISIAIGIFLALLAPARVSRIMGPLIEMLAAIPSVIVGFFGLIVLGRVTSGTFEPALHSTFGLFPIFGSPQTTGDGVFLAMLVVAIMIVPIVSALTRDLFKSVPKDMQDGATALGATRWEVIRGVVLPYSASGVTAACFLGLGRATGEAIAVTQVVGAGNALHASLFQTGDTLASRIAEAFPGISPLHTSALFYLALVLLAIGLATNLTAQWISRRFARNVAGIA